jgi:RNA polymerase sigma-70 factor (ECF subfamily)
MTDKLVSPARPPDSLKSGGPRSGAAASDARLLEDARRGDRDAFGELVRRYERRLLRLISRFVPDFELARDLTQETFLRVYERLDQFDPSRRFGPWLFRIGVNLTLDYLRRRKRRVRWSLFSDAPADRPPDPSTPDPRQALDVSQEVQAVLDELPEKYRSVLVLRDLENFSTSEVAAILNRKEATIRWRLAEARNRFKEVWTRRQAGGSPPSATSTASHEIDEQDSEP